MPRALAPDHAPPGPRRLLLVLLAACDAGDASTAAAVSGGSPPVPGDILQGAPGTADAGGTPTEAPVSGDTSPVPGDISQLAPGTAGAGNAPIAVPVSGDTSHVPGDIYRFTPPTAHVPADTSLAASSGPGRPDTSPVQKNISTRPPPGLVDLRAALPGACFDVRYATADNFTGAVLPGYEAPGSWLRARPAEALARAQAALGSQGLTLLVYDAYRPVRASLAMVEWAERSGRRRLVDDGYIARRSGHNRGDTIDLTLARAGTCEPLDMGTAWDHLGPESNYARAAGPALANRRLLRRTLQAQGFTPYDKEWWHFTFRDPDAAPLDIPYAAAL
ncbi:M15 family metallopeptidase [Nannocystis punicea]|uniref:D-alanyl-D-alanine dipeptidase n=1 Tax=Nannocystis punicea TaxID=2995304 RepID=A0ABY7H874_9BACT|nr:M15 family metallopeptidase [Nannocystis poenicansa]WAS95468.1 hypothetical protein O0S08_04845 [Nannocystis poenicansa]